MIFWTGDTHGIMDQEKIFKTEHRPTPDDHLIIAGDLGIPWFNREDPRDEDALNRMTELYPCRIWFCDGNHENFSRLNTLPTRFHNEQPVGKLHDRVHHLRRGLVYQIDNKNIFVFGGGLSVDRIYRTPGESWWKEEIPTREDMDRAVESLKCVNNKVDYVLTHEGPHKALYELGIPVKNEQAWAVVKRQLDILEGMLEYKAWVFGHYHFDKCNKTFKCLYHNIITLD